MIPLLSLRGFVAKLESNLSRNGTERSGVFEFEGLVFGCSIYDDRMSFPSQARRSCSIELRNKRWR